MLQSPNQLRQDLSGHGLRPYDYVVEFSSIFGSTTGPWVPALVKLESLQLGYGPGPFSCQFSQWDPDSVEAPKLQDRDVADLMIKPQNGEVMRVWVRDPNTDTQGRLVFQGTIRGIHDNRTDAGVVWMAEAVSDVARLDEVHVTFTANERNDPTNPSPRFDANGILLATRLRTVAELAREVLEFRDAWGKTGFFTYADLDWNGLETDPRCGAFIPSQVSFENTPQGQALGELLKRAGNFELFYRPTTDGRGKLVVVEINLACDRCGYEWPIDFLNTHRLDVEDAPYAHLYSVQRDATQWSSHQTANVCRITSAPIRLYSGDYMIPEILDGNESNCVSDFGDTVDQLKKRATSLDHCYYRFSYPKKTTDDKRTPKLFWVGLPLFPDWNVHEDYLPDLVRIAKVGKLPTDFVPSRPIEADEYRNLIEFEHWTVGDAVARGEIQMGHVDNLRTYQAWFAKDSCPACQGSGLVNKVYDNDFNEPQFYFYLVNGSSETAYEMGTAVPAGKELRMRVINYLYDPAKFGSDFTVPQGMHAFEPEDGVDGYPLPWKHLCPMCRGVGLKPEYKIRNIHHDLFTGRNNQATGPGYSSMPISADPDATQTAPESWEQATNRLLIQEQPRVCVEVPVDADKLPKNSLRNQSYATIHAAAEADRRYAFPHPLQYRSWRRRKFLAQYLETALQDTGDDWPSVILPETKIVPDSWRCEVPHTTILMNSPACRIDYAQGKVQFESPQFIPCRKEFTSYLMADTNTHLVGRTGLLQPRSAGRGYVMLDRSGYPTGFWRHAKVWMQFFYSRSKWYDGLEKAPDQTAIKPIEIVQTTPDGIEATYQAKAMVVDGALAIEVVKLTSDDDELSPSARAVQTTVNESSSQVETHELDLRTTPLLPVTDLSRSVLAAAKQAAHCRFTYGHLVKYERTSPGEVMLEAAGYVSADYKNSLMRPKPIYWTLKDERPRLLALAIRQLECTNNLQVSGSLELVGFTHDTSLGLGWIDYPERGRAAIRRLSYNFTQGLVVEVEVVREEARAGEMPREEKDLLHDVYKRVVAMERGTLAPTHNPLGVQMPQARGIGSGNSVFIAED